MVKTEIKARDLEILISTMQRTSLSFLSEMFSENNFLDYNILIVNQTSKDKILTSNYTNIRALNSFEKGLSRSRNLAIKNTKKSICLIADDDVKYVKGFEKIILNAFKKHQKAAVITFQMVDDKNKLFVNYPHIVKHNKKTVSKVNSVVIALQKQKIISQRVIFNKHFGLGALFETGDEYVFLRTVLNANLDVFFEPQIILSHGFYSSGKDVGSDRLVYARSAIFYKYSGVLSYLKLWKYLFLIYKSKYITIKEIFSKYSVGLSGIKKYKQLLKQGVEKR